MKIKSCVVLATAVVVLFSFGLLIYAQDTNNFSEEIVTIEGELVCGVCKNIGSGRCKRRVLESVYLKVGSKDIFAYTPDNYRLEGSFDIFGEYWNQEIEEKKSKNIQVTIKGVRVTKENVDRYQFLRDKVEWDNRDNVVRYVIYELTIGEHTMKFN